MEAIYKGKALTPEVFEVCVVYDPSDGRIIHTHERVRFPGAVRKPEGDAGKDAMQIAAKLGHDTSKLQTLAVPPAEHDRRKPYKVDLKSKRIVVLDRPIKPMGHMIKPRA
jgi:hypothetical protein